MVISNQIERPKGRVIRDKAFAKRLDIACEGNPHCPTELYRGKQKWVYDGLEQEFGIKVSSEAVRKWFKGESRPRPKIMTYLARLLEVDEAWLSLGLTPDLTPAEKRQRDAMVDGVVNLLAGLIQIGGGHIAFPDDDSADIFAIIGGKNYSIDAVLPLSLGQDKFRLTILDKLQGKQILAVMPQEAFQFRILQITPEVVRDAGDLRGNYWEMVVEQRGSKWKAGGHQIRELGNIREITLDAARPPPTTRDAARAALDLS